MNATPPSARPGPGDLLSGPALDAAILASAKTLGAAAGAQAGPRILAKLYEPDVQSNDLAQLISTDVGLAARVLKVANSPYYGLSGGVGTVDRAVLVLGLDAVRGIAAAACLDRALPPGAGPGAVTMNQLLRHSVATATAAQALARRVDRDRAGDAFLAGLLHDLGVVIQQRLNLTGVAQAVAELAAASPDTDTAECERRCIGFTHGYCGALIFTSWLLPAWIGRVVEHHPAPLRADPDDRLLASIVHLAERLAGTGDLGLPTEPTLGEPDPAVLACAGVSPADLEQVAGDLPGETARLLNALGR